MNKWTSYEYMKLEYYISAILYVLPRPPARSLVTRNIIQCATAIELIIRNAQSLHLE